MTDPAPDAFGPWASGIGDAERCARFRSLAALAMVFAGGGHPLLGLCIAAEDNPAAAPMAWAALKSLAPLTKRRMLSAYCALAEMQSRGAARGRRGASLETTASTVGAAP